MATITYNALPKTPQFIAGDEGESKLKLPRLNWAKRFKLKIEKTAVLAKEAYSNQFFRTYNYSAKITHNLNFSFLLNLL